MRTCKELQRELRFIEKQEKSARIVLRKEADKIRTIVTHRSVPHPGEDRNRTATQRRLSAALNERTKRHNKASAKVFDLTSQIVNLREALKSCKRRGR